MSPSPQQHARQRRIRRRWIAVPAVAATAVAGAVALTVTASASTLLSVDFESGASGWSTSGGAWTVVSDGSHVLQQSNRTSENAREFRGSTSWTTYTLQARLKALSLPQPASSAAVLAHATASTSFDRLALLGSGQAQLQAVRSGRVTVLGTISLGTTTGGWHTMRVQESGNTVTGWVDGLLVGTGTSQAAAGRIGLQTVAGTANFDDVSVDTSGTSIIAPPSGGTSSPASGGSAAGVSGYATVGGTTTGGAGGSTVTVTSGSALASAAGASGASVIKVNGQFACSGDIAVAANKSIIGVGANSGLTGCGLSIKGVSNVIVQNLKISKVTAGSGSGDAIHIDKSHHVWVDHNDLSSDLTSGKDYYDGLVDITHGSDNITVSWNYLHDHYKAVLIGHSDSNAAEDTGKLHVTLHHNYVKNINSRTPSLRFGTGHVYDNYFVNGSTGAHSRMGAQMLVQNNVWTGVGTPVQTNKDSSQAGYVNQTGNNWGTGTPAITQTGTFTKAPYGVTLDPTSAVIGLVTAGAGTGHAG